MDDSAISKLSSEQIEALNDQQKAVFCALSQKDQTFFASAFSIKDLPVALERKGAILQRNAAMRSRIDALKAQFVQKSLADRSESEIKAEEILTGIAGAIGIGAAAHAVATDHSAHYQGVEPRALIPPLRAEFEDKEQTDISFDGSPDAMEGTVFLESNGRPVPALTINLTRVENGVEVKVSDLTSQGMLETVKKGGQRLLGLAGKGFALWNRKNRGFLNPLEWVNSADSLFSDATGAAEVVSNLKLEERAWKVIKNSAETQEKAFQDHVRLEREAQSNLERAWDAYTNCPTCAVPFGAEDQTCRVCGTARPPKPATPDPRRVS